MAGKYITPWHGSNSIFVLDPADSGKSAKAIGSKSLALICPYCLMNNVNHKFKVRGTLFDQVQCAEFGDVKYYDARTFWENDSWDGISQTGGNQSQNVITKFYAHYERLEHGELLPELAPIPRVVQKGDAIATKRGNRYKSVE